MNGLKIFITLTGNQIVAQELSAKDGKRVVKGASYLEMHPSGVRFNFTPIKFFEPSSEFTLYEGALLGEQEMPPMIAERFKLYLKQMEVEAEELRKQIEVVKEQQ